MTRESGKLFAKKKRSSANNMITCKYFLRFASSLPLVCLVLLYMPSSAVHPHAYTENYLYTICLRHKKELQMLYLGFLFSNRQSCVTEYYLNSVEHSFEKDSNEKSQFLPVSAEKIRDRRIEVKFKRRFQQYLLFYVPFNE